MTTTPPADTRPPPRARAPARSPPAAARPPPGATPSRPVMPRCMTSTSPDERSASRYLARRPSDAISWPVSRAANPGGGGGGEEVGGQGLGPAPGRRERRARQPSREPGREGEAQVGAALLDGDDARSDHG